MRRARKFVGIVTLAGSLAWATSARADEEVETKSYAVQTVTADGISIGLVTVGILTHSDTTMNLFAFPGVIGYALATPIIHGIHGNWARAVGSLALRVLVIPVAGIAGGVAGASSCDTGSSKSDADAYRGLGCFARGFTIGAGLGAVAVSAFDAIMFANETVPKAKPAAVQMTPTIDPSRRGATIGVGGAF
jgi:hypothetical protein